MRRTLFLIVSILVSALFLWLALRDIPREDILSSIRQADLAWVAVSLGFGAIGLWTRGIRWRGLLNNRIGLMQSFNMLCIAMLLNQLPLRAGEVARSALATRSGVPFFTAATSVLVERLLDTLAVVIVLAAALTQLPDVEPALTQVATLFGVLGVIAVGMLLVFARKPDLARDLLSFFERVLPPLKRLPLRGLLENILDGIQPLARWRSAVHAIFWTAISWALSFATFYALALSIGATHNIGLMTLLSVTMASFALVLPVSVAAIGPFEGAVRLSGQAVGLGAALATALGFLFHGINVLTYAIWGTIGLLMMGVSLGDVLNAKNDESAPANASVPTK